MICNICASTRWQVERSDVLGLDVDLRRCLSCGFKTYNRVLKSNAEAHSSVKMADRFFRYWTNMPSRQTREQRASNERHARALYVRLLDRLQSHAARPLVDLFDVGSGWGRFMVVAKEEGFSVAGCDINPREAENGRSIGLDVQAGDFTTVDVQSESWDVVAMLDVLEHVWTPREFVEKAVGMLRPGGLLLVKTFYDEYHDEVPVDLSAGAPRYGTDGPNRGYFDPICHPSHFTRPVLRWLLERCGLSLIDEEVERSCGQVTLVGRKG